MKFTIKQQNPDLYENNIEEMMTRALGNESNIVAPCSFVAIRVRGL